MVGGPCSGKTHNANKIAEFIQTEKKKEVVLINEEWLDLTKANYYKDSNTEKLLRAKLKSEVEKHLDDNKVVILDYLNYIKGYRYELFCLVRNFKTRLCLVYLKVDFDVCLKYNALSQSPVYSEELLKDLYSRMEEPKETNRWDNPLFTVFYLEECPYEQIYGSLFEGKRPKDPVSTKLDMQFDSSFLNELDSSCGAINSEIMKHQSNGLVESIRLDDKNFVYLKKVFSGVELKNLKQEYIKICKRHPPSNKAEMIRNYVEYINTVQDRYS